MVTSSHQIILNVLSIFIVTSALLLLARILVKRITNSGRDNTGKFLKFFYLFFGFLLLLWPIGLFISIFLFDAPSSTENPFVLFQAWSIWSYPAIYLLALIGSRILFAKKFLKASVLFAIMPSINFIWLLSLFLLPLFHSLYVTFVPEENPPIIEQDIIGHVSECEPPMLDGGDGLDTTGCGTLEVGVIGNDTISSISESHNWQFTAQQGEKIKLLLLPTDECPTLKFKFLDPQGQIIKRLYITGSSSSCLYKARTYDFYPPTTGTYILRIETPEYPGEYRIEIER